jgi:hypothetical protein
VIEVCVADEYGPGILAVLYTQPTGIPTFTDVAPGMIIRPYQDTDVFVFFTLEFGVKHVA